MSECRVDAGRMAAKIVEQQRQIARLTAERDEARRECCARTWSEQAIMGFKQWSQQAIAESRGWDCFKEDGK